MHYVHIIGDLDWFDRYGYGRTVGTETGVRMGVQGKLYCDTYRTCTQFIPQGSQSAQTLDTITFHYITLRTLYYITLPWYFATMVFCYLHCISIQLIYTTSYTVNVSRVLDTVIHIFVNYL